MLEELEQAVLSPWAALSSKSRGRARPEEPSPVRTEYQRDRDRIIHSKAFRRLKDKTQVFIAPEGAHYRNRLTHTLEVAQIARTIARALRLNEDLTEAIALGHDLGHTPFGHAGESILNSIHPGGFKHNEQSLRVVDALEKEDGLNLTWEVRDGILNHPGDLKTGTLEGQIIKIADRVAYINHDIDDALRGGVIQGYDLPPDCVEILGRKHSDRINVMVTDIIRESADKPEIQMSPEVKQAMNHLRDFLFERVYIGSIAKREEEKAKRMLGQLYNYCLEHFDELDLNARPGDDRGRTVCDYVAGMTDHFALAQYQRFFLPLPWQLNA
ncbi:MAG: deoxyguanosinetriphosphate triphosphohydrolase [Actinobacteria bacterium]|nr:deoxyguanosinetriphosphate triphosphohydrolase [Actinomycetota bacterium]